MINRDRIVNEFITLVGIDSLSKNERLMADKLKSVLSEMGFSPYEDNAGELIDGNAGNIVCLVQGKLSNPPIAFMAHMDTVTPGIGKCAKVTGDIITSDGTTVLGGDDLGGVVSILEALRVIKEQGIEHGDIYIVFTVAEEIGLFGARNLDLIKIPAKFAFILDDGGDIGSVAITAPSQNKIDVTIKGKAAHAGVEPENGISAIQIAADAISRMKLGRIDEETTANIGIIKGGEATNIICDEITIKAEARSRRNEKLEAQTNHMIDCFKEATAKFKGSISYNVELIYSSYSIDTQSKIIQILEKATNNIGLELSLKSTGGGSDTNIINQKGIPAVNLSIGMKNVHSVNEQISISDICKSAELLVEIIKVGEN